MKLDPTFLPWLYEHAKEEYGGDINKCLLEMNAKGEIIQWYFLD